MRHSRKLVDDRSVDPRVSVAMNVAPQTADTIEQTPALCIDQPIAFGSLDQQRLIISHLRKAMPMMKSIGMRKLFIGLGLKCCIFSHQVFSM
jgi:hypothetical protein